MRTVADTAVSGGQIPRLPRIFNVPHLIRVTLGVVTPKRRVLRCHVAAHQLKRRGLSGFWPSKFPAYIGATVRRRPHLTPTFAILAFAENRALSSRATAHS
jgi:hypothetical protein